MGLTRPRAHQLQDIDYKQTARAVTSSNITLSGGTPATVDGVSLLIDDRVLVNGQTDQTENGIYYVTTLGSGSNGTWTRTGDANATGEMNSGMIIMVTEGTGFADTQWMLTTDGTITIGTTNIVFAQTSSNAFGIVAVAGQDNLFADSVGDTLTISAGTNLALTTNASTDTLTITPSLTPSLTSVSATGNITGGNITTAGTGTFGTMTDGTVSFTSGNISGVDELRIDQTGTGLRMTNVGAFDNDGSNNFRVFATNDLKIAANGNTGTAITIDATNQDVTITNDLRVDNGNLYIGGTAIISTAAELNILDGVTVTASELNYVDGVTSSIQTQLNAKADTSAIPTNNNELINGAGYTTNVGDITNVSVSGTGLSGGGSSGAVTITSNATSSNTASTIVARDGSGNFSAGTITATSTSAQYADLAEKYTTDQEYPIGTVMKVSTHDNYETDAATIDSIAIGVISHEPAYLMNSDSEGQAIGLKGRVPVRVVGAVNKGNAVYCSNNGTASAEFNGCCLVGISLESNSNESEKLVECVLKV